MKKLLILLLIWIYPLTSFAMIDECKTDVYFGNGILTEEDQAEDAALNTLSPAIESLYGTEEKMKKHIGKVAYAYNSTHLWGFGDLIESALQKLDVQSLVDAFLLWKAAIRTSRSKKMVSGHKYNYSGSQKKQASSGANLLPEQS